MERIGLIELGTMGKTMSENLLRNGFHLTVWNPTPAAMDDMVS